MFRTRLATAAVLLGLFLAALFYLPDFYWTLLMLAVVGVSALEWALLAGFSPRGRYTYLASILSLGGLLMWQAASPTMFAVQYHLNLWLIFAAFLFWVLLVPAWLIGHFRASSKSLMAVTGILVLLPTWMALVGLRGVSPYLLLGAMATIWIADTAAYLFGKRFGRHKLAPLVSPGKTWEGVLGALLAVTIYGLGLNALLGLSPWLLPGLWCLTVLSIIGDLFESLLKRQAGLKDSGALLPGHGGMLDRIDGLTSTLPLIVFYLYFPLYYTMFVNA